MNYTLDRPIENPDRVTLWEARRVNAARKLNKELHASLKPRHWLIDAGLTVAFIVMMWAGLKGIDYLFSMFTI